MYADWKKAGRPKGSTNEKKREQQVLENDVKHNIICNYIWEIQHQPDSHSYSKKQVFENIVLRARQHFDLPDSFHFPYSTALSRIRRSNLKATGNDSPLIAIEPQIVELAICMSKLKRSLTCSDGLRLVNELIQGTEIQQRLIKWKKFKKIQCSSPSDLGKVGKQYWKAFLRRNRHVLRNKLGRRFSVHRSNWTTYLNFWDMYLHIQQVLINDSKIARLLPEPVWMNEKGEKVDSEKEAFGCKVQIDIHRPDMGIVFDEVGCNLSQEGDNSNGGENYLCGVRDQAYQSSSTKTGHFTSLGVTSLDGSPIMCVVIIKGKKREVLVESGIEWDKLNDIDDTHMQEKSDYVFFEDNFGDDKLFPGGPTCTFKGKQVPAFITFTESGGIDGYTLTTIFKKLDALDLYTEDRKNGLIPFALLDGHQSRFDLDFLRYINEDYTRWNVCIGVPYGTALWQVGDRSQQNGTFKMSLSVEKKALFENRLNTFQHDLHLMRTDILPLICKSWPKGFGNVENNQKAIALCGWVPFTYVLLLDPVLRATMTEEMIQWEQESGIFPSHILEASKQMSYVEDSNGRVFLKSMKQCDVDGKPLNFSGGAMAQHVATTIISEFDRQKAREVLQQRKREGLSRRDRIMRIKKKLTAGKLVLDGGSHSLDRNVLDFVRRKRVETETVALAKRRKEDLEYMKSCIEADDIAKKYGDTHVSKWRRRDEIVTYIKPLKRAGDAAMPSSRSGVEERYHEWKDRSRRDVHPDNEVMAEYNLWLENRKQVDVSEFSNIEG